MVSLSSVSLVGPVIGPSGDANLRASPSRGTLHQCFQPGLGRTQGPLSAPGTWSQVQSSFLIIQLNLEAVFLALQQPRDDMLFWIRTTWQWPAISQAGGGGGMGALSSPTNPSLGCMVLPSRASVCNHVQPQTSNLRSVVLVPTAGAVDALSIPWSSLLGYAFPPLPIVSQVR